MGSSLDVARWQFAITTVYHFLFVPVTIGMSAVVAYFHTQWVRTHRPEYLRLTKFFGKLFLINFALGLVTGIVQEFQFGMNWSDYSRFVGDIFGAPLAFEALLARRGDRHDALHEVLECLGETLWRAQKSQSPPDGEAYLDCLRRRLG